MEATKNRRPGDEPGAAAQVMARTRATVAVHADSLHGTRVPAAYATIYGPTGRRRRWIGMVRCSRRCRGGHLIFGDTADDLAGLRTIPCGRVYVVVARVVRAVSDAAA